MGVARTSTFRLPMVTDALLIRYLGALIGMRPVFIDRYLVHYRAILRGRQIWRDANLAGLGAPLLPRSGRGGARAGSGGSVVWEPRSAR